MKKIPVFTALSFLVFNVFAQQTEQYFPQAELTTVGAYYYPEHWDESQWVRDFKKMGRHRV